MNIKNIAIIIDPWKINFLDNYILFFRSPQHRLFKNIKRFIDSSEDIDTIILAAYDNVPIDKLYINWKSKQTKLFLTEEQSFEKLLKTNDVKKIYMCGSAWDECVRNRPLGYINVASMVKTLNLNTEILVKNDCVLTLDDNYFLPDRNSSWLETDQKDIYRFKFSN